MAKVYKDKSGKKYVITSVMIEHSLYEELLKLVPEYGSGRGWLSHFVNQALKVYLAPRKHTQIHANPTGKIRRVFSAVLECLREMEGGVIPLQTLRRKLEVCIESVRGGDPRTKEKWIKLFLRHGLLKDLTPHRPPEKKVYEIVGSTIDVV